MATRPSSRDNSRDPELGTILEKVRQMRNFDFRNYKQATLLRRVERRMRTTGCRNRAAYLALLDRDPYEMSTLVSSMLIKLTPFFRDPEVWLSLEQVLAERLLGLTEREALGQQLWTLSIPALKRSPPQRLRRNLAENHGVRLEDVAYQLPHGGRGHATVVATPLINESTVHGAVILFEDTTRAAGLAQENRELKEKLRK